MSELQKGIVTKAISGFFYVLTDSGLYECKGRGILKKDKLSVVVGDYVDIEIFSEDSGHVKKCHPRRNSLIRPNVSNIDYIVITMSMGEPKLDFNLLDKFLALAEYRDVRPIICINKVDDSSLLDDFKKIKEVYGSIYPIFPLSIKGNIGIEEFENYISGKSICFAGPSGVGKSTIVNHLIGDFSMETGGLSKKTGRGRHTTRHSEIFFLDNGTKIFDTPGFTALDVGDIPKEELKELYLDFVKYDVSCKFSDCNHIHEKDCGIKDGVSKENIAKSRYQSYVSIFDELSERERSY